MRYEAELDAERERSGWGRHFWIIDTQAASDSLGRRLELIPEERVERRLKELNG